MSPLLLSTAFACSSEGGDGSDAAAGRGAVAGAVNPSAGRANAGNGGVSLAGSGAGGAGTAPSGSGGGAGSLAGAGAMGGTSQGGGAGGVGPAGTGGAMTSPGGSAGAAASSGMAGGGAASGMAGEAGSGALTAVTVYIAGDSTVQTYADTASKTDQAGWGQMFAARFGGAVTIENRAIGGRTARRFIDEGRLDGILEDLSEGDYLFVQFGTNDGNRTATYELNGATIPYYLDPATDFKTYLRRYLEGARAKGATVVFVTPPPRNSAYCTGGNGTGAHAEAMRELGGSESVAVADLNQKTVDHLKAICPAPAPEDFFLLRADGTVDGTHFQENGARVLAGLIAAELQRLQLPLAQHLR